MMPAKMQAMEWSDLRYVLTVARAGTLVAAARRLSVNQTTVARRLAAAERALGARLFERRDGVLHPTKAGEAAIAQAARVEQEFLALERGVAGTDAAPAGTVRVTAVPILANRLLIPALPGLLRRYPQLRVELVAESRNLSLTRREADIALRLARPEAGTALVRRIGRLDYAVYGPRRRAGDLAWITYEEGSSHLPQARFIAAQDEEIAPLAVNDAEGLVEAVRAGIGKSLVPCFVGDRTPGLRRLGRGVAFSRDIWLLVHRDLRTQARIAAVVDWIIELMPACRAR
ncbi:MAG TPA: LysR family transcriptional regulator [Xanthobacteraceae bacterium]|nr:LysR family transcriptional regulator [Xanthobacteraceae bacterium]